MFLSVSLCSDYGIKLSTYWVCQTILFIRTKMWLCHRERHPYFYLAVTMLECKVNGVWKCI
jgi:hypothetical protein